jgi:hypothetical protein
MPCVALVTTSYSYFVSLSVVPASIIILKLTAVGNLESGLRIRNINVETCNLEIAAGEIQVEVVSLQGAIESEIVNNNHS